MLNINLFKLSLLHNLEKKSEELWSTALCDDGQLHILESELQQLIYIRDNTAKPNEVLEFEGWEVTEINEAIAMYPCLIQDIKQNAKTYWKQIKRLNFQIKLLKDELNLVEKKSNDVDEEVPF